MIIFVAVDSFSQLPVSLECVRNNKSEALLYCFIKDVTQTKNVWIKDFTIAHGGPEHESMICGKSTHNQHIK